MPADSASTTPHASGKSRKNKKKKGNAKTNPSKETGTNNHDGNHSEMATTEQDPEPAEPTHSLTNGSQPEPESELEKANDVDAIPSDNQADGEPQSEKNEKAPEDIREEPDRPQTFSGSEPDDRFEALVRDRDSLRAEVVELRKTLEQIQSKHDEDMGSLQTKLETTQSEKQNAETQFRNLLGKVNTIKSQLGERLKADAEELGHSRTRIEELESQNETLKSEIENKDSEIESLAKQDEQRSKELSSLRNRTNLSQQNWIKEREDLVEREAYVRAEFEEAKQAMHNWEILAMEERSVRESLGEKVVDLEEQLTTTKADYERSTNECNSQAITLEGLQNALQEIQTARKQELRELVESSDAQIEDLRKKFQNAEKAAAEASTTLESTQKELERALPFEKEVKEKNLLIGKLRHEAVTLNEHLTKALRFLKKGKPEDNVDRNIVTNHFLHFLTLDRSDPKKFQILQLIAALLNWTDEQREQAGLARPGSANLRVPGSLPVHRTPSSPALATDYFIESPTSRKESLAELWSSFLEQEAQTNSKEPRSGS